MYNSKPNNYGITQTLHSFLEVQAEKNPNNIAFTLISEEESFSITYRELNEQSNQLANFLIGKQIAKGKIIALAAPPGFSFVTAAFAIWKIGCICMFINPKTPYQLINEQLKASKTEILLTTSDVKIQIENQDVNFKEIKIDNKIITEQGKTNPEKREVISTDPALVFYTSGSTGKPKGVLNGHYQFVNSLIDMHERYKITAKDNFILSTQCTFDPIIAELVLPTLVGAKCFILPANNIANAYYLKNILNKHDITLLQLTPTILKKLLDAGWQLKHNIKILSGGEILTSELANRVASIAKEKKLTNVILGNRYGITETTTYSTENVIKMDGNKIHSISVGIPIKNTQIYILNEKQEDITNTGEKGEIYIGGAGVAFCYLNNPKKTKDKFIKNPFSKNTNEILYKSGDFGHFNKNGELIFEGRMDREIKLYGVRINLDSIEKYIKNYIDKDGKKPIKQCAVILHQETTNLKFLLAYIEKKNISFDKVHFNNYLAKRYSGILFPKKVFLKEIPTNSNGKIDRVLLAEMFKKTDITSRIKRGKTIEETLINTWEFALNKTLDIDKETTHFIKDLNGDSISTLLVTNLINDIFLTNLNPLTIYQNQTVSSLAKKIKEQKTLKKSKVTLNKRIKPANNYDNKAFQATPNQYSVWLAMQSNPQAYNVPILISFEHLDREALKKAVSLLAERHNILRSNFIHDGKKLIQKIKPFNKYEIKTHEHNIESKSTLENTIAKIINNKLFKLEKDTLMSIDLVKTKNATTHVCFTFPHIIMDGISENIFCEELLTSYLAFTKNTNPILPTIPCQYVDFAIWQKQFLAQNHKMLIEHWQNKILNLPFTKLNLPKNHENPSIQGRQIFFPLLDKKITSTCKIIAAQHNCTLHNILLSAFYILLFKYSGQKDIAIGTAKSGRIHLDANNLIGHFVYMSIMRNKIDPSMNLSNFFQQTFIKLNSSIKMQALPYIEIYELIKKNGLTEPEIMFASIPKAKNDLKYNGLEPFPFKIQSSHAKYPLTLFIGENNNKLECIIEFMPKYYSEKMVRDFFAHYCIILQQLENSLTKKIDDINYISDEEISKLKKIGVGPTKPIQDASLNDLFEKFANSAEYADHAALIHNKTTLTYKELNQKASALALRIYLKTDIKNTKESVIAIYMNRCLERYLAIHAALKLNATFVPLTTKQPKDDIKFKLNDSKVTMILTQEDLVREIDFTKLPIISVEHKSQTHIYPTNYDTQIKKLPNPNDIIYIIYTSGTTGKPKGVRIKKPGVINCINALKTWFSPNKKDKLLAWATFTFDASIWDFLLSIMQGTTLVIPNHGDVLTGKTLAKYLKQNEITILSLTPSALAETYRDDLITLRTLICGGERLSLDIVNRLSRNKLEIFNVYGPTENTIWTSGEKCRAGNHEPSIGMPIQNVSCLILDKQYKPVPPGVVGELYIAGIGVAHGYTQVDQTTKSFLNINHPFEKNIKIKVYKTGDNAYWGYDGKLCFVGRIGRQIKHHGYRIELDSIEKRIKSFKKIENAAVLYIKLTSKQSEIIACVKFKNNDEILNKMQELFNFLQTILIHYEIPKIIPVNKLYITKNGKLDYTKIQQNLAKIQLKLPGNYPITETEKKISSIWEQCLSKKESLNKKNSNTISIIPKINRTDSFLFIGGDSIKITHALNLIKNMIYETFLSYESFEANLKIMLFNKTLQEIAEFIDKKYIEQMIETNCNYTIKQMIINLVAISNCKYYAKIYIQPKSLFITQVKNSLSSIKDKISSNVKLPPHVKHMHFDFYSKLNFMQNGSININDSKIIKENPHNRVKDTLLEMAKEKFSKDSLEENDDLSSIITEDSFLWEEFLSDITEKFNEINLDTTDFMDVETIKDITKIISSALIENCSNKYEM